MTHNLTEAVLFADRVFSMTPRPGRFSRVIEVPFERPRSLDLVLEPEFQEIVHSARQGLSDFDTEVRG